MKVGDLVKWTHPHARDVGVVLEIRPDTWMGCQAYVEWASEPRHSGLYPVDHELLVLINTHVPRVQV